MCSYQLLPAIEAHSRLQVPLLQSGEDPEGVNHVRPQRGEVVVASTSEFRPGADTDSRICQRRGKIAGRTGGQAEETCKEPNRGKW